MPKFMLTTDEETDAWLRKQGGGGRGSRQKAALVFINLMKNGLIINKEGVRKVADNWLSLEERKAQLKEQLDAEMTDDQRKGKEQEMQLVIFRGDLMGELQEKLQSLGISQETRDTILAVRQEQVKLSNILSPDPSALPPPPPSYCRYCLGNTGDKDCHICGGTGYDTRSLSEKKAEDQEW